MKNHLKNFLILSIFINLIFFGSILNYFVVEKNSCLMPVYTDDSYIFTKTHFSYSNFSEVKFPYLTDIFYIDSFLWTGWISIGDVLIYSSFIFLVFITIFWIYKDFMDFRNTRKHL